MCFDEAGLGAQLFGPHPAAEVLIGELDGVPRGFALFFHNFSTFEGRRGLYLEDLYVQPEARGMGLGLSLVRACARIARERDCARFEWAVLDWNEPSIAFYRALGAEMKPDWRVMRVEGDALRGLAEGLI